MFETLTAKDWLTAGSSVLGNALGGKAAQSGAESGAMGYTSADFSGFSVSTGGGVRLGGASSTPAAGSYLPYIIAGLAALWLLKRS